MRPYRFAEGERRLARRFGALVVLMTMLGVAVTPGLSAQTVNSLVGSPCRGYRAPCINVGNSPSGLAVTSGHMVYVADSADNNVTVVNGTTYSAVMNMTVGDAPVAAAFNPKNGYVYVADSADNNLTVINPTTTPPRQVMNRSVGSDPVAIAVDPVTGLVYVANEGRNTLTVLNSTNERLIATVRTGDSPAGVAVNPSTGMVYVADSADNNVTVISSTTTPPSQVVNVTVGRDPVAIAYDSSTGNVYVVNEVSNTLSVIRTTGSMANTVSGNLRTGNAPDAIAVNPSTQMLYVADSADNNVTMISSATSTQVVNVTVGTDPTAIAVDTTNGLVYVANSVSNTVSVIQGATSPLTISSTIVTCPTSVVAQVPSTSTCKATVMGNSPTGAVTWSQGGTGSVSFSATECTLSTGSCSMTLEGLKPGSVTIKATYSGDSNNRGSSGTAKLTIVKATPSVTTTLSHLAIVAGQSVYDSAALKRSFHAGGTVTYEYFSGGTCSGASVRVGSKVTVTNGAVPRSASVVFYSVRVYSWEALYSGDANNKGATSPCEHLTVTKAPTHTSVSCTAITSIEITCTATVVGSYPSHTGTIAWSKVSGTGSVTFSKMTCKLTLGRCSVTVTATAKGSVKIEVTYGGDSHNLGSSGTIVRTIT